MRRRDFVGHSSLALITAALAPAWLNELHAEGIPDSRPNSNLNLEQTTFRLTQLNNPNSIAPLYVPGARAVGPAPSPYVYAYYDGNKFINPLATDPNGVKPSLEKGTYSVTPTLQSFNIQQAKQAQFKNLKSHVQLGFNATAPIGISDQLSWIFMSAIDIFLAKDNQGRQDQLTKFKTNNNAGTTLTSNPKISVANGLLNLQVTAFGQKQDSFWTKFFDVLSKVSSSPIVSAAS
jgi:hypothetical protein